MDRVNCTEWVFEKKKTTTTKNKKQKKKKNACFFQGSHFVVLVGEGRVIALVVCVGGSVGVLMRFVWRSLGVGMGVLGGGGCVF